MPVLPAVLALLLVLVPQAPPTHPAPADRDRVRPMDAPAATLVAEGARRAPTIAALLDRLAHSALVVYISLDGRVAVRGTLTFVAHGGGVTYVLVRIQPVFLIADRLAALAHELQHAVEVADAGDTITDANALAAYYRRIGTEYRKGLFESVQARVVEAQVRREITAPPAAARNKQR